MGKPKAPKAPDPQVTAAAQTGTNVSTAIANAAMGNVNQVSPGGSLTYQQTGTHSFTDPSSGQTYNVPTYTATTSLDASQQRIFDTNTQTNQNLANLARDQSGRLQHLLGTPFSLNGLPAAGSAANLSNPAYTQFQDGPELRGTYGTDWSQDRQKVEDALMARLNPQLQKDKTALETNLANQGIRVGSTAWASAMDDFNRGSNDARFGAILNASQEQSRLAGLDRDRATFENAALQQGFQNRNTTTSGNNALADQRFNTDLARFNAQNQERTQAVNERFAERNQPINEIASLMSGAQVQNPNFVNTNMPSIPTLDYAGLVQQDYANRVGAYNTQMAQRGSILGGLFGLGANMIMASDRRLKRDVRRLGTYPNGLGRYSWRYAWGTRRHVGVMSHEVRKRRPEAVIVISGYDAVDYRKALA